MFDYYDAPNHLYYFVSEIAFEKLKLCTFIL